MKNNSYIILILSTALIFFTLFFHSVLSGKADYYVFNQIWLIANTSTNISVYSNVTFTCGIVQPTAGGTCASCTGSQYRQNSTDDSTYSNTSNTVNDIIWTSGNPDTEALSSTSAVINTTLPFHGVNFTKAGTYYVKCAENDLASGSVWLNSTVYTVMVSVIIFNAGTTNDSFARPNDTVNFTMTVSNSSKLSGYIFSENFTSSDGTWRNSSWKSTTSPTFWNASTATKAGMYAWRFYANETKNIWNVSNLQYFNFTTRTLLVNWTSGSNVNATTCTQSSPCTWNQYNTTNINGTVTCLTNPSGQSCGSITGGLMYNGSLTTYNWTNTTTEATPMYVTGGVEQYSDKYVYSNTFFNTSSTGLNKIGDITSNGTYIWVLNRSGVNSESVVRRFFLNGTFDPTGNWTVGNSGITCEGLAMNSTHFGVTCAGASAQVIYHKIDGTYVLGSAWNTGLTGTHSGLWFNRTHAFVLTSGTNFDRITNFTSGGTNPGTYIDLNLNGCPELCMPDAMEFNGTTWFITDLNGYWVKAWDDSTKQRVTTWNISTTGQSTQPYGLTLEENEPAFYVGDLNNMGIFKYVLNSTIIPANPISLGTLNDGQTTQVNFTVNATQAGTGNFYNITVNFSSSISKVSMNYTPTAYVCIGGSCITAKTSIIEYYYNESLSKQTVTSTTANVVGLLTFTPTSTGNYTILATAEISDSSTSSVFNALLAVNGTIVDMDYGRVESTSGWKASMLMDTETLTGSSNVTYEIDSASSSSAYVRNVRIFVYRMGIGDYYNSTTAIDTSRPTTYATEVQLTPTISGSYAVFYKGSVGTATNYCTDYVALNIDTVVGEEMGIAPPTSLAYCSSPTRNQANRYCYALSSFLNNTYSNGQHTFLLQYKAFASGSCSASTHAFTYGKLILLNLSNFGSTNVTYNETDANTSTASTSYVYAHHIGFTQTAGTYLTISTLIGNASAGSGTNGINVSHQYNGIGFGNDYHFMYYSPYAPEWIPMPSMSKQTVCTAGTGNYSQYILSSSSSALARATYKKIMPIYIDGLPTISTPTWSGNTTSPSSPATYSFSQSYTFTVVWSGNCLSTVLIEHNLTAGGALINSTVSDSGTYTYTVNSMTAGNYSWRMIANNTNGQVNATDWYTFTVNKASPSGSIAFTPSATVTYPTQTTATPSVSNSGGTDVVYYFYRNTTQVSTATGSSPSADSNKKYGAGSYVYVLNTSSATFQNYSSSTSIDTKTLTVSQNSTSGLLKFYINNVQADSQFSKGTTVNFTVDFGGDYISTVYLDSNYTGWAQQSASDPLYNSTQLNEVGTNWNFTASKLADTNYTSYSVTYYVNVTQLPLYSLNSTNTTIAGKPTLFSLNWTSSAGLSGFIPSFDNCTGTLANGTWTSFGSDTWSNFTYTVNSSLACTIRWCVYANDTLNAWNGTSCQNPFSYSTAPSTVIALTISTAITKGIQFGIISANTIGNPAFNNSNSPTSGTMYNITIDSSTTDNVDVYSELNESFISGIYVNQSSSTTSESSTFSTNSTITTSWSIMGNSTLNCTNVDKNLGNCWIKYYIDIAYNVGSGVNQKTWKYCGVKTTSDPNALC